jgi:hypothetical protein
MVTALLYQACTTGGVLLRLPAIALSNGVVVVMFPVLNLAAVTA